MNFKNNKIISFDGYEINFSHWGFENSPKEIIIALHGMNDYAEAFYLFGPYLEKRNIALFAIDIRGFGRNKKNRGDWAGIEFFRKDICYIYEKISMAYPNIPISFLGESMGGAILIVCHQAIKELGAKSMILVAPAVYGWSSQPFINKIGLWIGEKILRGKRISPPNFATKKITASNNQEMLYKIGRDCNMIWQTKPETLKGLVDLMEKASKLAPKIDIMPCLVLFAGRDDIIPPQASYKFRKNLSANVEIIEFQEVYHMMLRDLEREIIFEQILKFLFKE